MASSRRPSPANSGGFTLVELLALLGAVVLTAGLLAPAFARARPNSRSFQCLNNLRQFTASWSMYAADQSDRVPNNFGISDTQNTINSRTMANWANDVISWDANQMNTNLSLLEEGILGPYLNRQARLYHCPADNYVSSLQRSLGWTQRARSISMSSVFGRFSASATGDVTAGGLNWAFPQYLQYLKSTRVPKPQKTWLILDEHPDSINDGYFICAPSATGWQDIPASFHNGGCGFSFADGHSEIKFWLSNKSKFRIQYNYPSIPSFDPAGRLDFAWLLERTGYVDAKTGAPAFNY